MNKWYVTSENDKGLFRVCYNIDTAERAIEVFKKEYPESSIGHVMDEDYYNKHVLGIG